MVSHSVCIGKVSGSIPDQSIIYFHFFFFSIFFLLPFIICSKNQTVFYMLNRIFYYTRMFPANCLLNVCYFCYVLTVFAQTYVLKFCCCSHVLYFINRVILVIKLDRNKFSNSILICCLLITCNKFHLVCQFK